MIKKGLFNFKPNRRLEIPKANDKTRPLGISSPRDKIVQKALHAVLEANFEPKFLNSSHGFRPKQSVHSALLRVYLTGQRHN
jgi:retron-type reverse transcriptase